MKVSRTPGTLNIKINDTNLKQVKEFKYLGSIFTQDGWMNWETENRIQKANNVSYQLAPPLKHSHSDIPMEAKNTIINSIFVPTLTYQCQTWTMTKPLERKITTCEMRCSRKAVNKTRRDMIPNTKNREMVGTKSIHHHIQQQRIKWFGHLTRLPIQHPAQRAYNTRLSGRKARGRPRRTWINRVKETLSLYNIPPAQAFWCAADKRLFRDAPSSISGRQKWIKVKSTGIFPFSKWWLVVIVHLHVIHSKHI